MAVNSRQHPLEIPPPSAKDWPKEEEENFFLLDPDRKHDVLPQPFRMIHKLVMQVFESAVEIIEEREMLREAQKRKVQPTKCFPTAEFQEDISQRSLCVEVVLSRGGDYAGILLQGNTEAWLEIYQLPKDSWLTEMEENSRAAEELAGSERRSSSSPVELPVPAIQADIKLDPPELLLTVRPPKPITGTSFKGPLDALKEVGDGSMFGLGYNHLIKDSQWELQDAIFCSTYQEYLEAEGVTKEEMPRYATFHFLLPSRILMAPEMEVEPDIPVGIGVHWYGNHNFCLYLLNPSLKDKAGSDLKPDLVWPCAAPIACSAVSSCSRYLALAGEDATITIWDKHLGYPLSVTAILEERFIRSIHFLYGSSAVNDETRGADPVYCGADPLCAIVQLLVLCTDSSFYLVRAPKAGKSSITLLADRPENPNLTVSAVMPVLAFPSAVLIFCWDGTVSLMNTDTSQTVYCFCTPPSHAVAPAWQPVFTVDSANSCLLLRGDEHQHVDEFFQSKATHSTIFVYDFNSYPLKEAIPKKPDLHFKPMQELQWTERCNIYLRDRFRFLPERQEVLLEMEKQKYWDCLQERAAAMDKEREKMKGEKKQ
ncbi:WD repeat-containing protein 93 isoform X2 [Zonotrichia albicollis]|uniref:WD repeat-containing protein 93 isoform X2 n=1 Tax=Zonotrichia albicollis TaxID=44394 RepID=UPI003D80FEDD